MTTFPRRALLMISALALLPLVGCGDDTDSGATTTGSGTVRLLTHDSFLLSDGVLDQFTETTGIEVELIQGGDAGQVVNQAILTNGNPQADVLFGIDSTFLSRALDADLFVPYEAEGLDQVDESLRLDPDHRVTPITYGDVCLNYDKAWFAEQGVPVPTSLADLVSPVYEDRLVVENPATSSPGLAFLLASIEAFGEDGWEAWWSDLRANGVQVTDGWEEAYNSAFSGGGASEGDRPLVVSYASSPPAEVLYADPPITESPVGVIDASCYRQVEGAGILTGAKNEPGARLLIDFLLGEEVQADVPLSMFVFPVRADVELPELFVEHAATPEDVYEMPAADIGAHREEWIDQWTDLVVR